jgi:hypothetical protein
MGIAAQYLDDLMGPEDEQVRLFIAPQNLAHNHCSSMSERPTSSFSFGATYLYSQT